MAVMNSFTESQGTLARLLATENISIQHGAYSTAFFDVKHRILGLPIWKDVNKDIYDLLCGHEVGHALYTPADALDNCPHLRKDYLNVVEDVRIEAKIQETYPGLIACFRRGYASFMERDFFGIKNRNLDTLSLADRINLKAKLGNLVDIKFTPAEEAIRAQIHAAKTWDDVVAATAALQEFVGSQLTEKKQNPKAESDEAMPSPDGDEQEQQAPDSGDGDGQSEENLDQQTSASGDDDTDDEKNDSKSMSSTEEAGSDDKAQEKSEDSKPDASASKATETPDNTAASSTRTEASRHAEPTDSTSLPAALTAQTLADNTKSLLDNSYEAINTLHCAAPSRAEINEIIVTAQQVLAERNANFAVRGITETILERPEFQTRFANFMKQTKRVVANMVKEFELRKAAYQYSRSTVSKTGALNLNKLHAYRVSDDIFLSVTNMANAKNHAMVLFVDYSGSMERVLPDVLKHVINLALFCRQASIPYRIFGFTSDTGFNHTRPKATSYYMDSTQAGYNRILVSNTNLVELVSSDLSTAQFNQAITHLFLRADSGYCAPGESLGNTPLDETLIAAHEIVKDMQARYNPDRMITMFITDGDGQRLRAVESDASKARSNTGNTYDSYKTNVVFKLNGKTITPSERYATHTKQLLNNLRLTTGTELIGFFIPHSRSSANSQITKILGDQKAKSSSWGTMSLKYQATYKDNEILHLENVFGYDSYFVVAPSNSLAIDEDEFEIDAGATRARIARQFINFSQGKKSSRVFVNKFAEAIA